MQHGGGGSVSVVCNAMQCRVANYNYSSSSRTLYNNIKTGTVANSRVVDICCNNAEGEGLI